MIGIYFSGTGNTKYCLERFLSLYDREATMIPLESIHTPEQLAGQEDIVFAYPIYYSNLPKIVRDFIQDYALFWRGKRIFILVTMGLFSGDGAGVAARLFRSYGAQIWGGLHLKMPDCICDVKALKRTPAQNNQLVIHAETRIASSVKQMKNGTPPQNGLGFLAHIAGLFGQRLWFFRKTQHYSDLIRINPNTCIQCGHCITVCPMNNLSQAQGHITAEGRCTLCYRCVDQCRQKAITILGKQVILQRSASNSQISPHKEGI